ncbi:VWA domain-containing protein [Natribacillus halophilus]|uniref:D-amino-acid dehydrogenase n=1 Tax=Natribacillus halophilus TaxID=549003 RepID=A0A1G8QBF2_9BACI|nr:VWA domain-containing protein [Natribacillus halophilus]SDJ01896.1 D-amino-acid dehydrogenase [Natribacillus halophilus]
MKIGHAALASLFLVLAACGDGDEESTEEDDNASDETPEEESEEADASVDSNWGDLERFAGDDPEEWMRAEPGTYHDEADEEAILEPLEAAAENGADEEELFYKMLDLTAEDYREYQDFFDDMEIDYDSAGDNPEDLEVGEDGTQLNVQVLFDASGSMAEQMDGGTKMDLAKDAVEDFVSEVPEEANISLRVYGHEGSNQPEGQEESCAGTEEVYPLGSYDEEAFTDALDQFEPTGYTPLGSSIEAAQEDLEGEDGEDVENIVYVVSDGEETCGGDPVQAAEDLNDSGIEAVVNIIGFDVPNEEQDALMDIADAGDGDYLPADTGEELREAFEEERLELIDAWFEWADESTTESTEQQADYREISEEMEAEMTDLSEEETAHLEDILEQLNLGDEVNDREIESHIQDRGRTLRSYMREESRDFRLEAVEEGRDERRDIIEEGQEEREELREQDIDD